MASQQYMDQLLRAIEKLPDEKAAQVVDFAESLRSKAEIKSPRRVPNLGFCRGQIRIEPSFFEPLPDDIIAAFEGRNE